MYIRGKETNLIIRIVRNFDGYLSLTRGLELVRSKRRIRGLAGLIVAMVSFGKNEVVERVCDSLYI